MKEPMCIYESDLPSPVVYIGVKGTRRDLVMKPATKGFGFFVCAPEKKLKSRGK